MFLKKRGNISLIGKIFEIRGRIFLRRENFLLSVGKREGERKKESVIFVSPEERQRDKKMGGIVIIELRSRVRFIEKKAYLRDHDYLPETGDDRG